MAVVATALALAALCGGWIYVFFIYDPGLLIDELADRTFPTEAEEICAVSRRAGRAAPRGAGDRR